MGQRANWFVRMVVGLVELVVPINIDKRLKACIVDFMIIGISIVAINMLFVFRCFYTTKTASAFFHKAEAFLVADISCYIFMAVFILKDSLFAGNSIGKKYYGLKMVNYTSGEDISALKKVIRNLTIFIWPIEVFLMLKGELRIGELLVRSCVSVDVDLPKYGSEDILDD